MAGGTNSDNVEESGDNKVKSYKKWTKPEMDGLVVILLDLVGEGQKSDNGFRGGYLNTCVQRLEAMFPGTKFSEKNVKHRYQQWKRVFVEVKGIDGSSGMGLIIQTRDKTRWTTTSGTHMLRSRKRLLGIETRTSHTTKIGRLYLGMTKQMVRLKGISLSPMMKFRMLIPQVRSAMHQKLLTLIYYPDMDGVINLEPDIDASKGPEKESTKEKLTKSPPKKKAKSWALKSKNTKADDIPLGQISKLLERLVEGNDDRMNLIAKQLAVEETPPVAPARDPSYNEPLKEAEEIMSIVEGMDLSAIQQIMTSTRIAMNPFYSKMFLRLKPEARVEFVTAL